MRPLFTAFVAAIALVFVGGAAMPSCAPATTTTTTTTTVRAGVTPCPVDWDTTVIGDVNQARADNNVAAVIPNAKLDEAANTRATQLATQQAIDDHTRTPAAMSAAGYRWSAWGENTAYGFGVERVVAWWMSSAPHRANILDRTFGDVGVGCAFDTNRTVWWSLILGRGA